LSGERHRELLVEMRRALLAEFGARAIYGQLARVVRDPELTDVLLRLHEEEALQIERLRALMSALGARPRTRSLRRRLLAACLAYTTPVLGCGFALRTCHEAETTASRWYAQYREYLAGCGEPAHANVCAELSLVKLRHAQALLAWVT
jgi:rubrerythrin